MELPAHQVETAQSVFIQKLVGNDVPESLLADAELMRC